MHESLSKFAPYVEKGLLRQVVSPCGKLVLWNYTDHCTYERAWDDVTLNARGTVYEIETGKVVARAFPKFFNFGELSPEKQKEVLNAKSFETFEKMDGSLGIVYYYDGEWRVNTRGSFTSDQAIKGKEMLDVMLDRGLFLYDDATFLVEIIYPENKIIVDYNDDEKLSLLACIFTECGTEVSLNYDFDNPFDNAVFDLPKKSSFDSIQELQDHLETLDHTEEGYVVRLDNGYRVKFKSAEYLRVARVMNHMSPLAFWEKMENGIVKLDFLEHLPEEFRSDCDDIVAELEEKYQRGLAQVVGDFETVMKGIGIEPPHEVTPEVRKSVGLYCKDHGINTGSVFAYLLGKDDLVDKIVHKNIRPTGNIL